MTTKKRPEGEGPAKKRTTTKRTATSAADVKRPARRPATKSAAKPRIRASHSATAPDAPGSSAGGRARKPMRADTGQKREIRPKAPGAAVRKTPLAPPKRTAAMRKAPVEAAPAPSSAARELALALAGAGIEKKALGIEILDVTGKVDYADFLVVMTGRSDRHVHAIATGIEEEMRKRKLMPLSMEGLAAATWVLIDFGDVVVHVFQEDARALYDIEGLWIDAGRVPVPDSEKVEGRPRTPQAD